MALDVLSLCTAPIMLRQDEQPLARGTGFFYCLSEPSGKVTAVYLVTAIHVLTMHSPDEGVADEGNVVDFWIHTAPDSPELLKKCTVPLRTDSGRPTWVRSKTYELADVAILPVPSGFFDGVTQIQTLGPQWVDSRLKLSIASTVALIGYPYGLSDAVHALPVCKTGTIASEPYVDFQGRSEFLVDVAAFPGMSGAPVVALANGWWENEDQPGTLKTGSARRLLGVYVAMTHHKSTKLVEDIIQSAVPGVRELESLQLGHVWKACVIQDIISSTDWEQYRAEVSLRFPSGSLRWETQTGLTW